MPPSTRYPNASPTLGPSTDPHLLSPEMKRNHHTRFLSGSLTGSSPSFFSLPPLSRQLSSSIDQPRPNDRVTTNDHMFNTSPTHSPRPPSLIRQCTILLPDGTEQTFTNEPSGCTPKMQTPQGVTPRSSTPLGFPDISQTLQICAKSGIISQETMAKILQVHNCR